MGAGKFRGPFLFTIIVFELQSVSTGLIFWT